MLTFEASREREWGKYPELRKLLGEKQLPQSYFGWSSVADNVFEHLERTLRIALLVCEFESEVRGAIPEVATDVRRLEDELHAANSFICRTLNRLEDIHLSLLRRRG